MSSTARFLLEFAATGDQEVVAKIREVGTAGKETAADLQDLQGIEDPFAPIAEGADAAVAPIEGVGTAAEGAVTPIEGLGTAAESAVTPLTDMGGATEDLGGIFSGAGTEVDTFGGSLDAIATSGEAAAGGLTDANTMVGDFGENAATSGEKTSTFGSDVASVGGAVAALGGSIGTVVSTLFRYNAAQLSVEKANLAAARAAETYRKAEASIDKILATATSNTDAIAAARARLSAAQKTLNDLVAAGVTSGPQYEAALAAVQEAQAALAKEAAKGGVDVAKLTDAMEKSELSAAKVSTATKNAAKEQAELNKTILDSVFGFTSMGGSLVQVASAMTKGKDAAGNLITKMGGLTSALTSLGLGAVAVYNAFRLMNQAIAESQGFQAALAGDTDKATKKFKESWEQAKQSTAGVGPGIQEINTMLKIFGINVDNEIPKAAKAWTDVLHPTEAAGSATEKAAASAEAAGVAHGLFAGAVAEANAKLTENVALSDQQSAALNTVTGSALETAASVAQTGEAINRLTEADVQAITTLQKHTREQIVANAGYNNGAVAALQYQQALTAQTQSLVDDTDKKNANAQATLSLADSSLNARNAIATVNEEWANSVDRLTDLDAVMSNQEARYHAISTVANEFTASLIEESIELDGTIMAMSEKENVLRAVENAYKQGIVSIDEWVTGLATAAAEEQGAIDRLADFGVVFSDLPGYMEPTVESLQTFAEAAAGSGEAAQEMADQASEAFNTMASDGQKLIDGLSDVILEGGEDMEENWEKAWEKMPQAVRDSMSDAQMEEMKAIAQMEAAAEAAVIELGIDLKTEDFASARADFTANLRELASNSDGIWSEMWSRAAELSATGSEAMIARISEIVKSDESPETMLQQLEAAAQRFGPIGDSMGTNLIEGLKSSLSQVGALEEATGLTSRFTESARVAAAAGGEQVGPAMAASIDLSEPVSKIQEFENIIVSTPLSPLIVTADLSAVHQALATLTTKPPPMIISVDADIRAAQTKVSALTGTSQKAVMIYVDANISAAQTKISALTGSNQKPIIIYVDANISAAQTKISALTTGINSLKQSQVPSIAVNNATAIAQIRVVQTQINNIKQKTPPPIKVNNVTALQQIRIVQTAINNIKQKTPPKITVNASQALSTIAKVKSQLNSLKNINRTITYTYRTVGSRPAQSGMHETLGEDTMIAAHKGERVDIMPRGSTFKVPNIERTYTVGRGGSGTGSRPININVVGELNGRELIRFTRRGLVEEVTGAM